MSWYLSNYGSFNVFSSKSWRLVSVLPAWTDWVGSVLDRRMCPAVRMTRTVQERSCVVGVNVRSMSAPHQVHIVYVYILHIEMWYSCFIPSLAFSRHFIYEHDHCIQLISVLANMIIMNLHLKWNQFQFL